MTRRAAFDGTHQSAALRRLLTWSNRALRTQSGKGLRQVGAELGMSPATLGRYLSGDTPLSSEQFGPFAAAFDTTEAELIAACFPTAELVPASAYDPRRAMEDHGTFTDERMDQIEREVAGKHPAAQKARIDAEARLGVDPHAALTETPSARRRRIG